MPFAVVMLLCTAALFCFGPATAFTIDQSQAARLDAISTQMAKERRVEFLLVHAMKDNLLEDGKSYDFVYTPGLVKVNGQELTGAVAARYLKLINDYLSFDAHSKSTAYLSMRGDVIKLDEILDPNSRFRNPSVSKAEEPKADVIKNAFYPNTIIIEMMKDGITDTNRRVHISYTTKGLFVDEHPLSPEMDTKYKARFKELSSFTPCGQNGGIDIVSTPNKPKTTSAQVEPQITASGSGMHIGSLKNVRASGFSQLDDIHIYPNPATDYINIEGAKGGIAIITNALGQQVASMSFTISEASQRLDLHALAAGNYILQITTATGSRGAINISKQ
jgi:hypothetical protein